MKDRYKHLRVNPLKEFLKVFSIVIVLSFLAVTGLNIFSDSLVTKIPVDVEVKLLPKMTEKVLPFGKGIESPELNRILNNLLKRLEVKTYSFQIKLFCSEIPNAFALPGGMIGVTSKLLDYVDSENGLAFVIGHELGHFNHRHHLKGFGKSIIFITFLSSLGMGELAGNLFSNVDNFLSLTFSREQERESDDYGLNILNLAYGNMAGATEFFSKLENEEKGKSKDWMSTHPLSKDRVDFILAQSDPRAASDKIPLPASIKELCNKDLSKN